MHKNPKGRWADIIHPSSRRQAVSQAQVYICPSPSISLQGLPEIPRVNHSSSRDQTANKHLDKTLPRTRSGSGGVGLDATPDSQTTTMKQALCVSHTMAGILKPAVMSFSEDEPMSQYREGDEKDRPHLDPRPLSRLEPSAHPVEGRGVKASLQAALPAAPRPEPLTRWNENKTTTFRFFITLYSFIIMGMNDGAIGVRIRLSSAP